MQAECSRDALLTLTLKEIHGLHIQMYKVGKVYNDTEKKGLLWIRTDASQEDPWLK